MPTTAVLLHVGGGRAADLPEVPVALRAGALGVVDVAVREHDRYGDRLALGNPGEAGANKYIFSNYLRSSNPVGLTSD